MTLANGYDPAGNRTSLSATIGSTADFLNSYGYDGLNRLTSLTQHQNSGNDVAFKLVGFSYNDANQWISVNSYNQQVDDPGNPNTRSDYSIASMGYVYDGAGRIDTTLTVWGANIAGGGGDYQEFTYDAANRVTTKSYQPLGGSKATTTYSYDLDNQLMGASGAQSFGYEYDGNGNRTSTSSVASTPGPGNRLASDGTYSYSYDAEGNLILRYDDSGNARVMMYDHRNRLVEVADYSSATVTDGVFISGTLSQDVKYEYDTFNHLVSRTVFVGGSSTLGSTQKMVWDGQNVVLKFASTGTDSPTLSQRFLNGNAVDQVFAQEDASGDFEVTDAGRVLWLLTDNQGSTTDVVDNTGTRVTGGHFTYDPYGNALSGNTSLTNTLYTGAFFDAATGLQYNTNRWYDPHSGRFLSEDPIGLTPDSNPYRYVGNDPTDATDPSGLEPKIGVQILQLLGSGKINDLKAAIELIKQLNPAGIAKNLGPILNAIFQKYPASSMQCDAAAKLVEKALINSGQTATIVKVVSSKGGDFLSFNGQPFATGGCHFAVMSGGKIYDGLAPAGVTIAQYIQMWSTGVGVSPTITGPGGILIK